MNDLLNMQVGNDWILTLRVANQLVRKFPDEVAHLQNMVKLELEAFDSRVKQKTAAEKAVLEPNGLNNGSMPDSVKHVAIMREEKREGKGNA